MNRQKLILDHWILAPAVLLMFLGLLMVASASMVISDQSYGQPFHFLMRQSIYYLMGIFMVIIAIRIPIDVWLKYDRVLIAIGLILLVLVLIPGIGRHVNGSRRWLNLGIVTLQVSEFLKLASILYLAHYLERFNDRIRTEIRGFIIPMLVLSVMGILLLMEPDFGAVSVLTVTFLSLLFIAQVRLLPFVLLFIFVASVLVLLAVSSPYRLERIVSFMHPWSNAYGSGYQLTQSLIAFGRGGWFGVGLGNSVQKLFYLPEAHTDFIFAVLGEELGLLGELALLLTYCVLVGRLFVLAQRELRSGRLFRGYLVHGFGICLSVQCMINLGVNIGLLPTKGLTLPFISYGGSSILVNCFIIGILLRVSHEARYLEGMGRASVVSGKVSV
ncbi:MAG: putative lipid II flippase FtsW [Coxiellaceae bacterium]|nr:putative lipid II flippase FtsW [Coxiellaceae bacterium]|tara:strand:- start:4348 stop:5505 length:1158 start_codon:yes stop_codon:yes gene_type:complete